MSLFSPKRFANAYRPIHPPALPERIFTSFEYMIKSALFSCRMCGNCILQETAYICPMTCAKGLRNGMCGGSTAESCYVEPSRPCTWYKIYQRAEKHGWLENVEEIQAPLDGQNVGHETWLDLFRVYQKGDYKISVLETDEDARGKGGRKQFFYDVRQPEWWNGDRQHHPALSDEPVSDLQRALQSGAFVTTGEIAPPLSVNTNGFLRKVDLLKGVVIASNYTDNASASPRMSSLACSVLSIQQGLEPVLQMQSRDRDRYALQSESLGAAALGVRNVLCLSGDHLRVGPGPTPRPVQNDMDAVQLVWMLRTMRDEGRYLDGREIKSPPQFFIGAAASPYAALPRFEAMRTRKKVNAGAQFIQTQPIFDYDRFLVWLEEIDKQGLIGKTHIIAGLIPMKSAKAAHMMADGVAGVVVPPALVKRMDNATDQQEEGAQIALELIEKLKNTPGVSGLHLMAVHWEEIIPRLVEEGGLPLPLATTNPA